MVSLSSENALTRYIDCIKRSGGGQDPLLDRNRGGGHDPLCQRLIVSRFTRVWASIEEYIVCLNWSWIDLNWGHDQEPSVKDNVIIMVSSLNKFWASAETLYRF